MMFDRETIECPKCGRYTIVRQSETEWSCLNCNFSRDLKHNQEESIDWLFVLGLIAIALVLVNELSRPPIRVRPASDDQSAAVVPTPSPSR
ncbi:hypothetical protein [Baaleninema sp.]|uniref:hypothetical protein n=1 Tax=Baaleninema sp. TaxID=3101197 RepID=UPI003CFECD72